MNDPSLKLDERLILRGFQDRDDFEIIAQVRNAAVRKYQGEHARLLDASVLESLASTPARLGLALFGVIPSFQRQGIGSLLMERALHRAWELGLRTVDLSVRVENPRAISIYRRFGFQAVPERTTIVLLKDI